MKNETMKIRTELKLSEMGYTENEIKILISKYWEQAMYLKTAKEKARFMVA